MAEPEQGEEGLHVGEMVVAEIGNCYIDSIEQITALKIM